MANDEKPGFGPQNKSEELWMQYSGQWVIIRTQGALPDGLGKVERVLNAYAILSPFVGPKWDKQGNMARVMYEKGEATVPLIDSYVEPTTRQNIENCIKGSNGKQRNVQKKPTSRKRSK